jgi:hypothetical protein
LEIAVIHPSPFSHLGYNTLMDFFSPEDNLQRMAPEETRITSLRAEQYPDGRRVHVNLEITPFQKRPYIEVALFNGNGDEVASATIVEPMTWKLEFTMHLRGERSEYRNPYTVEAKLFYPDGPNPEPLTFSFDINPELPATV